MALIYDNQYHRITKSINDFISKTTEIEMDLYDSKDSRDYEKQNAGLIKEIKENINKYLIGNMNALIEKTNKIQPIDKINDADKFLKENPEIQKLKEIVEDQQEEGLFLIDKLSEEEIKFDDLKYKEVWEKCGLTNDFCRKIGFIGTASIGYDGLLIPELKNLYTAVKEKITAPKQDC